MSRRVHPCVGKRRWNRQEHAERALRRGGGEGVVAVSCEQCGGWHLKRRLVLAVEPETDEVAACVA